MITVNEALALLETKVTPTLKVAQIGIEHALHHVLAENIESPISMPPFRQSAMDGYAVYFTGEKEFKLTGEVQAGDDKNPPLKPGEAVRIFTGAAVPDDANAVVMQEYVAHKGSIIHVEKEIALSQNIRETGEQIQKGSLALKAGTLLQPAALGYLASLGIDQIPVLVKPRIAIIVTGNELRSPGQELKRGEIYESNALMLKMALEKDGFTQVSIHRVEDSLESTIDVISNAMESHDVLLISGGISVGDYDYVEEALEENEVEEVFYKVKQKPGKPIYFGITEEQLVFALPGNPASALSCFYIYVLPALRKMSGYNSYHLERRLLISENDYPKKGDRAQFLKAYSTGSRVIILDGQASSMIHSFAVSNALVFIPAEVEEIKKGDKVQVVML